MESKKKKSKGKIEIPVECLRRSSRTTKGVRVFDETVVLELEETTPDKKSETTPALNGNKKIKKVKDNVKIKKGTKGLVVPVNDKNTDESDKNTDESDNEDDLDFPGF